MMDNKIQIQESLAKFGLSPKEIAVYLQLHKRPWQTVAEIAEHVATPRPSIYRLLSSLEKGGLIESVLDDKTTYYAPTALTAFEAKIAETETKVTQQKSSLNQLESFFSLATAQPILETKISFYRGKRSIQSLEWRITDELPSDASKKEILIFGNNSWWEYLGQDFAEQIREKLLEENVHIREILNHEGVTQNWSAVSEYVNKLYSYRVVDSDSIPIGNEIEIVGNSVYLYSLNDFELVATKISSVTYANMMRGLFETVWKIGLTPPPPPPVPEQHQRAASSATQ